VSGPLLRPETACVPTSASRDTSSRSGTPEAGPLQHPRKARRIEVGIRSMQQAAVVPHEHVARAPLVAIDEALLDRMRGQLLETGASDVLGNAFQEYGAFAHEERLAAGLRDGAHQGMRHGRGVRNLF